MNHRVAEDGFYIPSPMLPCEQLCQDQIFTFDSQPARHQSDITTTNSSTNEHPSHLRNSNVCNRFVCEVYAPPTQRSQQRAVGDQEDVRNYATPVEQMGNFQYSHPTSNFQHNAKAPRRRAAIPYPTPERKSVTPSTLLKEEPIDPRYSCDVTNPENYIQNSTPLSVGPGHFSRFHSSPSDVTSPTESTASLTTVDDILKTCLVVLGDCDINLLAECNASQTVSATCGDFLKPDVISYGVPVPCDSIASPLVHSLDACSDVYYLPNGMNVSSSRGSVHLPGTRDMFSDPVVVRGSQTHTPARCDFPGFVQESICVLPCHTQPSFTPAAAPFVLDQVPSKAVLNSRKRNQKNIVKLTSSAKIKLNATHNCQYCQRAFTSMSGLRQHENTHTGARPFKCDFCLQTFAQRSTLRTHRRSIHTKERPYKCSYCERAFSDYSTHVKHERTHTGTKPYKCMMCGRAFSQSGNLYRHQATKHSLEELTVGDAIKVPTTEHFQAMQV